MSSQGLINKSTLNDIAESIIAKDGGEVMTPSQMATRIDNLSTGGSFNVLSAEDLTGYYAAANPTTADYIDYDEMSTSGRTFITETKNHATPFTLANSRFAECFNPTLHPAEGVVASSDAYYRAYVSSISASSITIGFYDVAGNSMGSITRNFTTSSSFGTTTCYCSVGLLQNLTICFTNRNALCIQVFIDPKSSPKVRAIQYYEVSNFGTFTKKDLFGGAVYWDSSFNTFLEIGSTGKIINEATGEIVPMPSSVMNVYSVAPYTSGVGLKTHVGLCCGKVIPIDNSETVSDLVSYQALPAFAKDYYNVDNFGTFINLGVGYDIAYTNLSQKQFDANTKQIAYTQLTGMFDYHLYDIDNDVAVDEIHGWVYNSGTRLYEKDGDSINLKGLLFDDHIIGMSDNDTMSLVPIIYDEELDSFIKYQSLARSNYGLIIYDNFVLFENTNTKGYNYNSYGEITAFQPTLDAKYIQNGIINLEVE